MGTWRRRQAGMWCSLTWSFLPHPWC
jgi:hypothetical protein